MSDSQPDVRWAPTEPRPENRGRVWLIVGVAIAALVIVGLLLFFLLPRGEAPAPDASGSPSPSQSSTPGETPTPASTPPAPIEPTLDGFREEVGGWLDDAPRGLDIVSASDGTEGLSVVETLEADAQRLSDSLPPSSIDQQWRDGVTGYLERLAELRTVLSAGSESAGAVEAARSAVQNLRDLVGL